MPIFGLLDAEKFSAQRFKNVRRSVFYFFPNGAAPLMGLLSLLEEETTNDPEFYWHEKVKDDQRTLTVANQTGSIITALGGTTDATSPIATIAAGATIRITVADAGKFRVGHIVRTTTAVGSTTLFMQGRVVAVYAGTGGGGLTGNGGTKQGLDILLQEVATNIINTAASVGLEVLVVGNVAAEGQVGAAVTPYNLPKQIGNYTQIQRTPFTFTGTAGKTSLTFDEEGPYLDKSMEASVNHSCEMEKNFIFGRRQLTTEAGTNLPLRFMGGVLWFLELWEAGTTYGNSPATADSDDTKRIITNAAGTMNEKLYDKYLERLFRVTNNRTNEKLCLCGSGFLMVMNQLYRSKGVFQTRMGDKSQTYGLDIVSHLTSFGTVHYRSHPLFSENPTLRFAALFLDIHNLKYRYMKGRDTLLLKNRQPNNADYREDEFLTESSLELRFPQAHMFMGNVLDYTA